jgi:NitT/TauT family transport system permease protein
LKKLNLKKSVTRRISADALLVAVIYAVIIAVWQIAYYILAEKNNLVKPYIFPNPYGVLLTFARLFETNILLNAILYSLKKMFTGFFISLIIGTALGLLISSIRILSKAVKPLILGLQTLPSICWIPFAILWFGLNESATIFVIIIGSTFSLSIAVEAAIKNVNPLYIRAAKTMGANKLEVYTKVILPASIPEFIAGLKQGWSFAWRALMAGEMMSSTMGLGFVLQNGRDLLDINQVMAVMIVIVSFSVVIEKLIFGKAEKNMRAKIGTG